MRKVNIDVIVEVYSMYEVQENTHSFPLLELPEGIIRYEHRKHDQIELQECLKARDSLFKQLKAKLH